MKFLPNASMNSSECGNPAEDNFSFKFPENLTLSQNILEVIQK